MSISSTTPAINPYAVAYSSSDISGTDTTGSKYSTTSSSKSTSTSSSSGSYSQGLVSQMSGLDVSSLVNESMASDVIKLNSLLAKQQKSQWTQDRYRSVISNFQNFSNKYFDSSSSDYILDPNGFSAYSALSTTPSVATASASNNAASGTYKLDVTSLATAGRLTKSVSGISNSSTLSQALSSAGAPASGTISFKVNGNEVDYDLDANKNKTLSQVMGDLSSLAGGATFRYSELNGEFSITNNTTGAGKHLTIDNADSNAQSFLNKVFGTNFSGTVSSVDIGNTIGTAGVDGVFQITEPGGTPHTVQNASSNNFTIDGVTYNVTGTGTTSINVSQDVSSIVSKIQDFVADYNNLVSGINAVTLEKSDSSYAPLTSAQESQMTTSQITAWNQKAQQGLLKNDGTLTGMLTEMRTAFYTPVEGNSLTMRGIGLSTADDFNDESKRGKIEIDVKKLTAALQSNPQGVVDLFTKKSPNYANYETALNTDSSTDSNAAGKAIAQRSKEEGIFQRISDIEKKYAGTYIDKNGNQGILLTKAGSEDNQYSLTRNSLYKEIKEETDAVSDFKSKMTLDSKMYNQKFSALQAALSSLSSQQSYLSSMLGSSAS